MKVTGAELVVRALKEEGVRFLFGIPGTHNIELYDRLAEEPELRPVLITDEQSAAFLADGVARASGQLAAANLVPGAGLTHAMSGIAECFLDQIPLLVLLCGIRRDSGKAFQLHDVDQAAIVRPVSKRVFQPQTYAELYTAMIEACRLAKSPPCGPAVVEVPANLYLVPGEVSEELFKVPPAAVAPEIDSIRLNSIVDVLNRSHSIALYLGLGAQSARPDLVRLADELDALVFTTISGKGVFPEMHPRWAWNILGRAAPPEIRTIAQECDCLLAIGCRFGEVATGSYGFKQPETLIHVDVDPGVFDRNFRSNVNLVADAGAFVRALLDSKRLQKRAADVDGERILRLTQAHRDIERKQHQDGRGELVQPHKLFGAIQRICGQDTVFVADSGNGLFLAMEQLRLSDLRSFLGPVDYSCMGYSVPAAIGAKLACPNRPVVALAGDGAFLMTGLELATASSYGVGVMVFLLRDRELSQIAQFQKASLNRQTKTEISDYSAREIAAAVNVDFLALEIPDDVESVVRKAFELSQQNRPVLVEVAIDYSVPTYFSQGVVVTNFLRFSWKDRIRLVSRLLKRKLLD